MMQIVCGRLGGFQLHLELIRLTTPYRTPQYNQGNVVMPMSWKCLEPDSALLARFVRSRFP